MTRIANVSICKFTERDEGYLGALSLWEGCDHRKTDFCPLPLSGSPSSLPGAT